MKKSAIILLGPNAAQCDRARRRGLIAIVIDHPERLAPGVREMADHLLLTPYDDDELVVAMIRPWLDKYDVCGVLSLTEPGLLVSAKLNHALGYHDNPVEVVERIVDKSLMREHLANHSGFALAFAEVGVGGDVRRAAQQIGFPVIVKPVAGAGSQGVTLVRSEMDLDGWERSDSPVVVEKFVEGDEFSVECITVDGQHRLVAITEKLLNDSGRGNRFVETGHCVPARVSPAVSRRIEDFVLEFLTTMGVRWGLSHTEVILSGDEVMVVETQTRNGGDRIVELVQLATGVDLLAAAIELRSVGTWDLKRADHEGAAAVRFFMPPPGHIKDVAGHVEARSMPGVYDLQLHVTKNSAVRSVRDSSDRIGMVVTTGSSPDVACRRAAESLGLVKFDILAVDNL